MTEWTIRQIEWYRDNKNLLPSQALAWGGFLHKHPHDEMSLAQIWFDAMTFGLLRQVYEKIANIGKQTLHKESEEFNMKKKVLSVILAAVCTMGLMAGCGAEGSKGSTQSGAKGDSYTVGISQFAEHGSLDN